MFHSIYQITHGQSGTIYIGMHSTRDLDDGYMGSGKRLKLAIAKHGLENFTKEILFVFDNEEDMRAKEAELVTTDFCLREDTYNLCPGGKGGFGYLNRTGKNLRTGAKLSDETKAKISAGKKGKVSALKGRTVDRSEEDTAKRSASISAALKGRPRSPEHNAKIAESLRRRRQENAGMM